mmetsp:Transcript_31326/g.47369  ORF Transcript_31326/g.47369 Transcript_31326/m.47369 type:complete len:133 (-) Transcript_31326:593-991(-)|eukprot:CAMPEP_0178921508 /NCGR_PEP_ID=MMETSP0786-20121207/15602_1 /TAXON_ID=186022 /ORGANISM="Thalassionema frauenfeldii, Strain CCMP 1798" /LENGTH=132 /DNA_ID=CAMNT_0020595699 /DNA_START=102 /DNA_END=500 /DNA_ORIENTATION=-
MASSKIPPHVLRELKRHVAKPATTAKASPKSDSSNVKSNSILYGVLGFLGFSCSIPFLAMQWVGRLNDKDDPLTAAQIRRGAFNNSGSRDVGKDPKWDFKRGLYIKDKDYQDLFAKDDPDKEELGDKFMPRR